MANRTFFQFAKALEKEVVTLFARCTFGASGAVTLVASQSRGIVSVTKNSTGVYTFVFGTLSATGNILDTYNKLLYAGVLFDAIGNGGTAPAAPLMYLTANAVATVGTASLQVTLTNSSGTATNPANTEAADFIFKLSNSSAV